MEIFGIGTSELLFILVIALIVLGPKDMQKAGKTIGRWLNNLIRSDGWKAFQQTSREIRNIPTNLMREANMEMMKAEQDIRMQVNDEYRTNASNNTRKLDQPLDENHPPEEALSPKPKEQTPDNSA